MLTTLDMLKIPYTLKPTFPYMGEQAFEGMKMVVPDAGHSRMPDFLEMNPQHNIPVYKEGDFVMNESRAIIAYLASKEGDTKLYPKDIKTRARVDQRLNFELASFFKAFAAVAVSNN